MKEQLCMIVENQPNVLLRVFRLLARYELNVDSLSVISTPDRRLLEITLIAEEESVNQQLVKMLHKLIEVVEVKLTGNQVFQKI